MSASKGGPWRRGVQRWHKKDELDDAKEEQERKKRNQDGKKSFFHVVYENRLDCASCHKA